MSSLYLVRHGQTALNAQGRFRGRLDPPLDPKGVEQARTAARLVAEAGIGTVCASPLRRTMETARIIAEACTLPVVKVPGLTDLDYGSWEGLTWAEASTADPKTMDTFRTDPWSATPPDGEAVVAVAERVWATLTGLVDQASHDKATAVVSHDIPIRLALATVMSLRGGDLWQLDVTPGSVVRLEFDQGRFRVVDPPVLRTR